MIVAIVFGGRLYTCRSIVHLLLVHISLVFILCSCYVIVTRKCGMVIFSVASVCLSECCRPNFWKPWHRKFILNVKVAGEKNAPVPFLRVISHQLAAAAPDPKVRRECPMTILTALPLLSTKLTALPLLSTNPGHATGGFHPRPHIPWTSIPLGPSVHLPPWTITPINFCRSYLNQDCLLIQGRPPANACI